MIRATASVSLSLAVLAAFALVPRAAAARDEPPLEERIAALERELSSLRQAEAARAEASELDELLRLAEAAGPPPVPKPQVPANVLNPRISVIPDFVAKVSSADGPADSAFADLFAEEDPYTLREVAVEFRAPVSPEAEAVAILAVGDEEALFEEAYLRLTNLPWDLAARIGRFRVDFGRANALHGHDLPQVDRPLVHRLLFGEEGLSSAGVSLSKVLFSSAEGGFLPAWSELVVEGINSTAEESEVLADEPVNESAFNARWKNFWQTGESSDFEAGLSFLASGENRSGNESTRLFGADGTWAWRDPTPGSFVSWLVQGELIQSSVGGDEDAGASEDVSALGGYLTLQRQLDPRWYVGIRADRAESPVVEGAEVFGVGPYVTFYANEFLRWRLQYQYLTADEDAGTTDAHALALQCTWVFGAHPPEPYWVNR